MAECVQVAMPYGDQSQCSPSALQAELDPSHPHHLQGDPCRLRPPAKYLHVAALRFLPIASQWCSEQYQFSIFFPHNPLPVKPATLSIMRSRHFSRFVYVSPELKGLGRELSASPYRRKEKVYLLAGFIYIKCNFANL